MYYMVNGCNVWSGDMMGSGIIFGFMFDSYGFMLEFIWKGEKFIKLNDGIECKFINDGDIVIFCGYCKND